MKRFAALAIAAAILGLALSCATAPAKAATAAPAPLPAASAPDPLATTPAVAVPKINTALVPYAGATKACLEVIEKAEALSSEGKWLSAYRALSSFDAPDADPFALAMKTSLVLRGAVRTEMHRSFGLADLEAGQDLETLRDSEGEYDPIAFDPPALADAQAAKGVAAPGILSKELGDYYYEVLGRFSGQWALSDEDILAKIVEQYARAYGAGVFDGPSLMNHAESLVRLDRGDDSDPLYAKALALEPKNPTILYSYAMSLSFRGKKAESLPLVDRAIEAYGEDAARINAIALGARTATELGDGAKAQAYYAIADRSYPDNPAPSILRHTVAIETGNKAGALAAAESAVDAFGSNPNVVRTLISTWYSAGDTASARDFLVQSIAKGGEDMKVATLEFYLGVLIAQASPSEADKSIALDGLEDAEKRFKAALGDDSEVIGAIAQIRAALQPRDQAPAQ